MVSPVTDKQLGSDLLVAQALDDALQHLLFLGVSCSSSKVAAVCTSILFADAVVALRHLSMRWLNFIAYPMRLMAPIRRAGSASLSM